MAGRGQSTRVLNLTEEEEAGVKGVWRKSAREIGKTPMAVGKLFSSLEGYGEDIAWTLGEVWCPGPEKGIRCKELGDNLFLFSFLQPGGKKVAISEGPWEYGGDLLVVADLDPSKRLDELEFNFIPIWIRVLDLPIGLMNVETGQAIGDSVGEIIEVECDPDGSAVGRYLRIRVCLDIRKPLRRGVTMEGEKEGEKLWCRFQYECLPNFCYSCGLLGHVYRECDRGDWLLEDRQFGDWLRVPPTSISAQSDPYSRYWDGGNSNSGGGRQLESRDNDGRSGDMGSEEQNALSIEDSPHVNSESELRDERLEYGSLSDDEGKDLGEGYVTENTKGTFKRLPPTIEVSAETVLEHPGNKRGLESRTEEDKEEHKKARTFPGDRTEDFPNIKAGLLSQSCLEK